MRSLRPGGGRRPSVGRSGAHRANGRGGARHCRTSQRGSRSRLGGARGGASRACRRARRDGARRGAHGAAVARRDESESRSTRGGWTPTWSSCVAGSTSWNGRGQDLERARRARGARVSCWLGDRSPPALAELRGRGHGGSVVDRIDAGDALGGNRAAREELGGRAVALEDRVALVESSAVAAVDGDAAPSTAAAPELTKLAREMERLQDKVVEQERSLVEHFAGVRSTGQEGHGRSRHRAALGRDHADDRRAASGIHRVSGGAGARAVRRATSSRRSGSRCSLGWNASLPRSTGVSRGSRVVRVARPRPPPGPTCTHGSRS